MDEPAGWRCRLTGHDLRFRSAGRTMTWECARGCGEGGSKEYATATDAVRFAAAFDVRATDKLGRRAPLIGMFPLRLWRRLRAGRPGRTNSRHEGGPELRG